jgi:CubicO group peptidase (beta-lactamase class C family)
MNHRSAMQLTWMTTMLPKVKYVFQRSSPEQQGVASAAILQFVEAVERQIHELHSFMLLRHGSLIAEGWWSPFASEHRHMVFSVSKSFTSTAVGLALAEGRFSIDDLVLPFFPEETPTEVNEHLAAMTVRHLLTMSTGHDFDTLFYMEPRPDGDWIRGFFELPIPYAPGTQFVYNSGASYMLSAIVQKTTGERLIDYLQPRLFEPLEIENPTWQESPQGIAAGGYGLSIKTEDIARFGQLYLQKGRWQGKQILPEDWVEEATKYQIANGDDPYRRDWTQGYGYQFWRGRHGVYRGDGVFGQFCIVMPEQDAVLAITGGMDNFAGQQFLDLVWDILLAAMKDDPLPDDAVAQQALTEKLAALALKPVDGSAVSLTVSRVSGRTYVVEKNELGLETITLTFSETVCEIGVTMTTGEEMFACGYDRWETGKTTVFNVIDPRWFSADASPVAASGAWTADDTFKMIVRLYESPFYHTMVFHFMSDELMIESQINTSLESMKPLLLTARVV